MENQVPLMAMLVLASVISTFFVLQKLRKSKINIGEAIFWFLGSFMLIIIAIFPNTVLFISNVLNFDSPINLVFLIIIFLLLLKVFLLSLKMCEIQNKLRLLVQDYAIKEYEKEKTYTENKPL